MDEKRTRGGQSMNAATYVDQARIWAGMLEDREARRVGSVEDARPIVSRKTGVPTGTLRSLRKGRLKGIGAHWFAGLQRGVIDALEGELRHVQHELQILRQTGVDPRSGPYQAALSDETRLRSALGLPALSEEGSAA